ncbi:hypothetical protein FPE89_01155 [Salmonella enterica subsp. diarizonae]|nr:hypothetical protein [Salmonella enterica subsp. diarizonae]
MTGNLFLKNDGRMHFAIFNEDGNARMWLYKDKDGDGVRLNNGIDGGGEFIFHKNGEFYSPVHLHAGGATFANSGDAYGAVWGNTWLSSWVANQLNIRATIDWVNQNFPSNLRWGGISSTGTIHAASVDAPAGSAVVGVTLDVWGSRGTHVTQIRHRPLHKLINGAWVVIETW